MAANTLWCFLVPLVVVICTASAASINSEEEFVNPIPLTRATNFGSEPCPPNEHFEFCGTSCPDNCTYVNRPCPLNCCLRGCFCDSGFVRHSNGDCVRLEDCPLPSLTERERTPECPSKESWDKCGALCQRNCTNFNDHPGVCPLPCVPGCVCQPGYVRGANGRCVKSRECPGSKKCPKGERYDQCSYLCQKNCTNYQSNEPCTYSCHPGCVCPEGYVRSVFPSGKCIKVEKCPKSAEEDIFWHEEDSTEENRSTEDDENSEDSEDIDDSLGKGSFCPKNEEFVKCEAKYEPDCRNSPHSMSLCVSGCRCKSGYVRGPRGTCIKKEECPEKDNTVYPVQRICPSHEYWSKTTAHCQRNCSHPQQSGCHTIAVPGCICKRGFLRRDDGKCVPQKRCPKTAESEQDWTDESVQVWTDESGQVWTDDQQPRPKSFCPKNERFSACLGHCEPNCKNKSSGHADCDRSICVSECTCLYGFVRGPKGTCIKPEECPKKDNTKYPVKRVCPGKEHWDASNAHCQKNCTNLDTKIPCTKKAVAGCVCDKGLYRNRTGQCVPRNQCSGGKPDDKTFCPPNESFSPCLGHCEADCKNKAIKNCDSSVCVSECKCLWGFVRGPKGDCIKPDKCPANDKTKYPVKRKCPTSEQWEPTKAHCQTNCTTIGQKVNCNKKAIGGCVCKKDNYRAKNGQCVPKKQCPKKADEFDVSTEDDFEAEFSTEEPSWLHRTDDDDHDEQPWKNNDDDDEENGDYDDARAKSYCPPNEFFASCIGHCEPDCKHKTATLQDCDRSICVSACKCKWGFVRGPKGDCIKPDKCPANDKTKYPVKRKCPAKEQWETSRAHCQTNCTTIGKNIPCTKIAVAGCVCKKNTYRAKNGECVPKNQCSKKADEFDVSAEDDFEAEFSTEEPSWLHRTDDDDHDEQPWKNNDDDDEENGDDDDARAKSYCPPNEFFASCIGHCEPDCKHKTATLQDCDKSICGSACKCKWGFVRGPKGDCIKPDKCPANDKTKYPVKRKCPAKEQWETSRAHCQTNCTTIGKNIPCTKIAVAGCVCKKNTYRAKNGECVPKNQCSKKANEFDASTEDDFEAEFSTEEPSWLHRTDDDDHDEQPWKNNDDDDEENGDDDDARAKSYCPPNEFFASCIGHCEPDCKHKTATLQDCDRSICVSACKCKWGFVRGPKGDCIKPDKCPANDKTKYPVKRKCPAKEQWETSRAHCQTNCTTIGKTIPCTKIAVAGCVCKKDTYRAKNGECVPKNQCSKKADEPEDSWNQNEDLSTESANIDEEYYSEVKDEVLEGPGGCPSDRKCTSYCRGQGSKYGRCVGRHRRRCTCRR